MFYQFFLSPQVKRWAIITYKHGIYEIVSRVAERLKIFRRWAGLSTHTRKKKDLGSSEIRKYQSLNLIEC